MHTGSPFIAKIEATKPMEPRQRPFDDPPRAAQPTAVWGATLGELAGDAAPMQRLAMRLRIVAAIALNEIGPPSRSARAAAQRREGVDQGQQLGDVVAIGGRQLRDERNPSGVGEKVMFRPLLAAIGRVRSSFFPPRNARTEALSTRARARSTWPRRCNSASSVSWSRRQTPARCHRTSRRQHVLPDPQPISLGSICQGNPARSTNRIPVKAARSEIGGRPMRWPRRRRRFGSNGSIRAQRASSMRRWDMRDRLAVGHAKVPIRGLQYKSHVSYF